MRDEELYEPLILAAEGRALRSAVEPENSRRDRSGVLVEDYSCTGVEYPVRTPEIVVELALLEEALVHDRPVRQGSACDKERFLQGRLCGGITLSCG